jgi:hypothetical protein
MTVDEYYAIIKRLGLRPTKVPHVYASVSGDFHSVPDPSEHSEAQRAETIERLKLLLGIGKRDEQSRVQF